MNKKKGLGKGLAALIGEKESLGNDINKPNDVSIQNLRQSDEIPIEFLHPNKNQPRKLFDEEKIDELSQSIKQKGLILIISKNLSLIISIQNIFVYISHKQKLDPVCIFLDC